MWKLTYGYTEHEKDTRTAFFDNLKDMINYLRNDKLFPEWMWVHNIEKVE